MSAVLKFNLGVNDYDVKFAREAYEDAKRDKSKTTEEVNALYRDWISKRDRFNQQITRR